MLCHDGQGKPATSVAKLDSAAAIAVRWGEAPAAVADAPVVPATVGEAWAGSPTATLSVRLREHTIGIRVSSRATANNDSAICEVCESCMTDAGPAPSNSSPQWIQWEWGEDLCAPFVERLAVTGASISILGTGGAHLTVCSSDSVATRLDELHLGLGEGPRWQVTRTGRTASSADVSLDADTLWPVFGAAATLLGARAVFACPIIVGRVVIGVVDMYRLTPGLLSSDAAAQARSLTRSVAAPAAMKALGAANRHDSVEAPRAPALRREVHQATGMVFVQMNVRMNEAFALLRAHAFASDRSVEDVARDVIDGRIDFRTFDD